MQFTLTLHVLQNGQSISKINENKSKVCWGWLSLILQDNTRRQQSSELTLKICRRFTYLILYIKFLFNELNKRTASGFTLWRWLRSFHNNKGITCICECECGCVFVRFDCGWRSMTVVVGRLPMKSKGCRCVNFRNFRNQGTRNQVVTERLLNFAQQTWILLMTESSRKTEAAMKTHNTRENFTNGLSPQ